MAKVDKQTLTLERNNIIRDRKGRLYYIEQNNEKAFRLFNREENKLTLQDIKPLLMVIPILLVELVQKIPVWVGTLLSAIVSIGILFNYFLVMRNLEETKTVPQEVWDRYNSKELLIEKRKDTLIKLGLGIVVIIMVMTNPRTFTLSTDNKILGFLDKVVTFYVLFTFLEPFYTLIKIQRKLKGAK